jgi:hypothetical protein
VNPLRALLRELVDMERADLSLRLLAVALLFQPVGDRWVRPVAMLVAAMVLLSPGALRSAWPWCALTFLATLRLALVWPVSDNHAYLLSYWCLAAAIAALSADRDRVLAWNGRALVAGAFAFATLWKVVLSPDFLDGRFFAVTLVGDPRFESFTLLTTGMDRDELLDLRDLVRDHTDGVFVPWEEMPTPPPRLFAVARALTLGTIAIEGAVAVAFAAPLGAGVAWIRDALLLLFCAGTYALAPVAGFGWLLLSMGVAQLDPRRRRWRLVYLAVFAIVLVETRWPLFPTFVARLLPRP